MTTKTQHPFPQVRDFLDESFALYDLVKDLDEKQLEQVTAFKNWTINDVIAHLQIWNMAAGISLNDPEGFQEYMQIVDEIFAANGTLKDFERIYLKTKGIALVELWKQDFIQIAKRFARADPGARVKWAGPDMSVRSSITARLMETWAHGQEIYDVLGVERENTDRIKNIVVLGVITYPYTYRIRREELPGPMPYLSLVAPSGKTWTFGEESEQEFVRGLAVEFAQVVTQTRNIKDTNLYVKGVIAKDWMSKAQCFAGAAEDPPKPGTRFINTEAKA